MHGIPTLKTVSNTVERNRSELELKPKQGKGIKQRAELVNVCVQHNIETNKQDHRKNHRRLGGKRRKG
jgi:hypothetical protein